jgi:DNA-binding CsgD family transcriptional regulator
MPPGEPVLDAKPSGIENLTERQKQVLRLIARHQQAKEIARALNIAVPTVKDHVSVARRHLGVSSSRKAALILADYEARFGTIPEPATRTIPEPALETILEAPVGTIPEECHPSGRMGDASDDAQDLAHEPELLSERRLSDNQPTRSGNSVEYVSRPGQAAASAGRPEHSSGTEQAAWAGEGRLHYGFSHGMADGRLSTGGFRVWLTGRLKSLNVWQCCVSIASIAITLTFIAVVLLAGGAATVQGIQHITGQTR